MDERCNSGTNTLSTLSNHLHARINILTILPLRPRSEGGISSLPLACTVADSLPINNSNTSMMDWTTFSE